MMLVVKSSLKYLLAEMFGYSTDLRSKTQGRATYSMEFKHYSETQNILLMQLFLKSN